MSAGGIAVKDDVVNQYNNLKLKQLYRFIQLKIADDLKEIEVEKTVKSSTYDEFVKQLPEKDCRYAVYNYQLDIPEVGKRDKIIFILWCPKTANVRTQMIYKSSKDAVHRKLVGINHEVQAADRSELAEKELEKKINRK